MVLAAGAPPNVDQSGVCDIAHPRARSQQNQAKGDGSVPRRQESPLNSQPFRPLRMWRATDGAHRSFAEGRVRVGRGLLQHQVINPLIARQPLIRLIFVLRRLLSRWEGGLSGSPVVAQNPEGAGAGAKVYACAAWVSTGFSGRGALDVIRAR